MNRLNRYAGLWEDQERAMRTPTSYRNVEWDLNTSPPMPWHFGPPPSGWGSYLSGASIPTARGQVVDARKFYTPPSVSFGRGFSGLGVVTATYREIAPGRYTTELTPYGVTSANAPGAPQILVEEVYRIFGGSFRPRAGWGSGAQAGKVWLIFATQDYLTPEGRGAELARAASAASRRVGGMLALPGQRPEPSTSGGVPASIALPADLVTLSARDLQTELARAGFNLGPSGVDGDFGSASVAALNAAVERTGIEGVRAKTRTSVTLTLHLLEAIRALPAADAPRGGGGGRIDAGGPSGPSGGGGGGVSGGSMGLVLIAAVGVGAYLMMRNR